MTSRTNSKANVFSTANLTRMAILTAIASILFLIEIPVVAFYKLDLSNIPVLLGAFSMGTLPGVVILALKSLIGLLHSSSAGVGELADFIMGAALIIPASLIYQHRKTKRTAMIGLAAGTVCMIVTSILVNKWIMLPFYMGAFRMDMDSIISASGDTAINPKDRKHPRSTSFFCICLILSRSPSKSVSLNHGRYACPMAFVKIIRSVAKEYPNIYNPASPSPHIPLIMILSIWASRISARAWGIIGSPIFKAYVQYSLL